MHMFDWYICGIQRTRAHQIVILPPRGVSEAIAPIRENDTQAVATLETLGTRDIHGEHSLKGSLPSKANLRDRKLD